mmetsp:Transcript_37006/g.74865  ORF Transcript_37006/g.74865 Transcript_37006/m.74865 type:complete len:209 (-) Transcript_37006:526-1152(-)
MGLVEHFDLDTALWNSGHALHPPRAISRPFRGATADLALRRRFLSIGSLVIKLPIYCHRVGERRSRRELLFRRKPRIALGRSASLFCFAILAHCRRKEVDCDGSNFRVGSCSGWDGLGRSQKLSFSKEDNGRSGEESACAPALRACVSGGNEDARRRASGVQERSLHPRHPGRLSRGACVRLRHVRCCGQGEARHQVAATAPQDRQAD